MSPQTDDPHDLDGEGYLVRVRPTAAGDRFHVTRPAEDSSTGVITKGVRINNSRFDLDGEAWFTVSDTRTHEGYVDLRIPSETDE